MWGKGKLNKPIIGSGRTGDGQPGLVDWTGALKNNNENPYKMKGFSPNDSAVNIYGGVESNDNPFEHQQENKGKTAPGVKKTKLGNA